ncbi:hypothetical protein FPV67DRAFT_295815 [Lyophyllum atratum]|nr:hypothetical protein FPV67DRAFT_295815 [Lyophyllum atratum]
MSGSLPLQETASVITTIPSEILAHIFEICALTPCSPSERPNRLAFSQICRRWRMISINFPPLWQRIDLANRKMAKEYLLRSGIRDLSIITEPSDPRLRFPWRDLTMYASRIVSINISLRRVDECKKLFSQLGADLTSLTSLSVINVDVENPAQQTFIYVPPDVRFKLKRLELHGVALPWSAISGNLTFLSLHDIRSPSRYCPSQQDIHHMLRLSPHLEHISLRKMSILPTHNSSHMPAIALPSLRELFLDGQELSRSILPLISLSPETYVHLRFRGLCPLTEDLTSPEACTLVMKDASTLSLQSGEISDEIEIHLHRGGFLSYRMTFLLELHKFFDVSRFSTLELRRDIFDILSPEGAVEFLLRLRSLETLRVAFNAIQSGLLFILLARSPLMVTNQPTGARAPLVCPCLKTISVGQGDTEPPSISEIEEVILDDIVVLARGRSQASTPLALLEFQFHIPLQMANQLRNYVAEVKVIDGGWMQ